MYTNDFFLLFLFHCTPLVQNILIFFLFLSVINSYPTAFHIIAFFYFFTLYLQLNLLRRGCSSLLYLYIQRERETLFTALFFPFLFHGYIFIANFLLRFQIFLSHINQLCYFIMKFFIINLESFYLIDIEGEFSALLY